MVANSPFAVYTEIDVFEPDSELTYVDNIYTPVGSVVRIIISIGRLISGSAFPAPLDAINELVSV